MAPKRKNDDESTARERKKQKMVAARTIAVQSTTPRSVPENSVAGPSRTVAFVDSESCASLLFFSALHELMFDPAGMKGLPSAIDVERFAEVPSVLLRVSA